LFFFTRVLPESGLKIFPKRLDETAAFFGGENSERRGRKIEGKKMKKRDEKKMEKKDGKKWEKRGGKKDGERAGKGDGK
jgi:hypothetical protein